MSDFKINQKTINRFNQTLIAFGQNPERTGNKEYLITKNLGFEEKATNIFAQFLQFLEKTFTDKYDKAIIAKNLTAILQSEVFIDDFKTDPDHEQPIKGLNKINQQFSKKFETLIEKLINETYQDSFSKSSAKQSAD